VDVSNLQRQVLHDTARAGLAKVLSGAAGVHRLNPHVQCCTHAVLLTAANAKAILAPYDVVLDCTDNVATRYLLSDACVLLNKPLVSGAALRWDGQVRKNCARVRCAPLPGLRRPCVRHGHRGRQLTVYHYGDGPCYRCLFPTPPAPDTVARCADAGVIGPGAPRRTVQRRMEGQG